MREMLWSANRRRLYAERCISQLGISVVGFTAEERHLLYPMATAHIHVWLSLRSEVL